MNRPAIGHLATIVLRQIGNIARIDPEDREKPMMIVRDVRATDWASLTFVGQRFEFELRLDGDASAVAAALARLETGLAEADIAIKGHFIAEIRVVPNEASAQAMAAAASGHLACDLCVEALILRD